jgi:hypothetical protein
MKKHYDMGGDVAASMDSFGGAAGPAMPDVNMPGMPDLSGNQMPVNPDLMTFGQAYRAARAAGRPTFPWRGGTYKSDLDTPKSFPAKARVPDQNILEATSTPERVLRPDQPSTSARGPGGGQPYTEDFSGYLKSRPTVAQARQAAYQNEMDALKALGGTAFTGATLGFGSALLGGAGAGAVGMGEGAEGVAGAGRLANMQRGLDLAGKWRKGRDIAEKLWRARTGAQTAAEHQATRPIQDIISERVRAGMGYKKGGKIHKTAAFNKGGHIRGSGCEMKGKTKGRVR